MRRSLHNHHPGYLGPWSCVTYILFCKLFFVAAAMANNLLSTAAIDSTNALNSLATVVPVSCYGETSRISFTVLWVLFLCISWFGIYVWCSLPPASSWVHLYFREQVLFHGQQCWLSRRSLQTNHLNFFGPTVQGSRTPTSRLLLRGDTPLLKVFIIFPSPSPINIYWPTIMCMFENEIPAYLLLTREVLANSGDRIPCGVQISNVCKPIQCGDQMRRLSTMSFMRDTETAILTKQSTSFQLVKIVLCTSLDYTMNTCRCSNEHLLHHRSSHCQFHLSTGLYFNSVLCNFPPWNHVYSVHEICCGFLQLTISVPHQRRHSI